ncbi:MAG: hypothetical protein ACYDHP_12285 [Ferrimicrobium sp.]
MATAFDVPGWLGSGRVGRPAALSLSWFHSDVRLLFPNSDQPMLGAEHWMAKHGNRGVPLLVGDLMWVDMVHDGWRLIQAVRFYKINTDPQVERRFPGGWRDMGYVVVTSGMRVDVSSIPFLATMIAHSRLLATFGWCGGCDLPSRGLGRRVRGCLGTLLRSSLTF